MALLAWLGLSVPASRMAASPPPPPVEAFLVPPPPRPRLPQDGRSPPQTVTFRPRVILPSAPAAVEPLPAPPPAAQVAAPAPPAPPPPRPPVSDGLREVLRRTVGCTTADLHRLTPAERAACEASFDRRARATSPGLGLDPAKEAAFDQAAAAKARERRARQGPMANPMVPCEGRFSNFGVGCTPD